MASKWNDYKDVCDLGWTIINTSNLPETDWHFVILEFRQSKCCPLTNFKGRILTVEIKTYGTIEAKVARVSCLFVVCPRLTWQLAWPGRQLSGSKAAGAARPTWKDQQDQSLHSSGQHFAKLERIFSVHLKLRTNEGHTSLKFSRAYFIFKVGLLWPCHVLTKMRFNLKMLCFSKEALNYSLLTRRAQPTIVLQIWVRLRPAILSKRAVTHARPQL